MDLSSGTAIFPIHSCTASEYLLVYLTARMHPEEGSVPVGDQSYTSVKFMVVSLSGGNEGGGDIYISNAVRAPEDPYEIRAGHRRGFLGSQ